MSRFGQQPIPLESTTATTVDTAHAAFYLSRAPQTLRAWASKGVGPVKPINVHGRLAWPVADIRAALGVANG